MKPVIVFFKSRKVIKQGSVEVCSRKQMVWIPRQICTLFVCFFICFCWIL